MPDKQFQAVVVRERSRKNETSAFGDQSCNSFANLVDRCSLGGCNLDAISDLDWSGRRRLYNCCLDYAARVRSNVGARQMLRRK